MYSLCTLGNKGKLLRTHGIVLLITELGLFSRRWLYSHAYCCMKPLTRLHDSEDKDNKNDPLEF